MSLLRSIFTATLKGFVPASGGGTENFLRADGTFAAPPGMGGTWSPPNLTISDVATSGAALFGNTAGYHISFDQSSDDAISFNIDLTNNGIAYDGSNLAIEISWSLFASAPVGGDNIKWDITYAFVKADGTENGYTISDGNFEDTIDVSARSADTVYLDQLTTMTGKTDATQLQVSMFRNSQGAGADTYGNAADLFKIRLKKV